MRVIDRTDEIVIHLARDQWHVIMIDDDDGKPMMCAAPRKDIVMWMADQLNESPRFLAEIEPTWRGRIAGTRIDGLCCVFTDEADAALFKLRWG